MTAPCSASAGSHTATRAASAPVRAASRRAALRRGRVTGGRSPPAEPRRALVEEGARPLAGVGGRGEQAEVRRLDREPLVERRLEAAVDRLDGEGERDRAVG